MPAILGGMDWRLSLSGERLEAALMWIVGHPIGQRNRNSWYWIKRTQGKKGNKENIFYPFFPLFHISVYQYSAVLPAVFFSSDLTLPLLLR